MRSRRVRSEKSLCLWGCRWTGGLEPFNVWPWITSAAGVGPARPLSSSQSQGVRGRMNMPPRVSQWHCVASGSPVWPPTLSPVNGHGRTGSSAHPSSAVSIRRYEGKMDGERHLPTRRVKKSTRLVVGHHRSRSTSGQCSDTEVGTGPSAEVSGSAGFHYTTTVMVFINYSPLPPLVTRQTHTDKPILGIIMRRH